MRSRRASESSVSNKLRNSTCSSQDGFPSKAVRLVHPMLRLLRFGRSLEGLFECDQTVCWWEVFAAMKLLSW